MEELPIAEVDFPEAKRLADLASILQDLTATREACRRLAELLRQNSDDVVLLDSLWTNALISYVRCFASGKRFGLGEDIISDLPGDPIGTHRLYKNLRDKHVAHSVNPFERVLVGVVLTPHESVKKEVTGVSILSVRHIAPDVAGVEQLMVICSILGKKVQGLAKESQDKVLDIAKTIPIEELYSRPRPRIFAPGPEDAGKAR